MKKWLKTFMADMRFLARKTRRICKVLSKADYRKALITVMQNNSQPSNSKEVTPAWDIGRPAGCYRSMFWRDHYSKPHRMYHKKP